MTCNNEDCSTLPICCNKNKVSRFKGVQFRCDHPSDSIDVCEIVDCLELRAIKRDCYGPRDPDWVSSCTHSANLGHQSRPSKSGIYRDPSSARNQRFRKPDCNC